MRFRRLPPLYALAGAFLLAHGAPVVAQEGEGGELDGVRAPAPDELRAHRLSTSDAMDLDGILAEEAWDRALPISDFMQVEPVEGAQPTERTEVRVVYDEDALWIGAFVHDDPGGILAYQRRRDAGLGTDDRFMWILDTFRDGRTGYFFEINAAGLMGDGLMGGGGGFNVNKSWDGIWEARTARLADGWSAEIRIPFSTLNFDPDADTWGINFQRTIRRRNEEIRWSGWRRNQGLTEPVHAGRLTGIRNISQGLGVEVTPYAVQKWRTTLADEDPTSFPGDVGFDVGYSITPSLRAAVSLNTDFAEVEVDQRRVNLTRFPQRFPEQRDFFLEGSGVYSFASRSGPSPYFSRRIGLEGGEPVALRYGARLGGQAGPYELGFMQVGTGSGGGFESEQFTVARVKRAVLERSTVGAVYTRRASVAMPGEAVVPDRHTAGVDFDYATSHLFGDNNFDFEVFAVWNSDAGGEAVPSVAEPTVADPGVADLTARGFRFNFPNDRWQAHLSYREFGNAYDPAVGFVTRNDFRRVEPRVAWRPRPAFLPWIRQVGFSAQLRYMEALTEHQVEERAWDFGLLDVDFESGDQLQVRASRGYEHLDRAFEVSDGIDVLPGGYRTWEYSIQARSAGRRPVSVDGQLNVGDFWDGERTGYQLGLTVRPRPGLSVSGDFDRNEVTLPRGAFDTNLFRLNTGWDLSPWASLSTSVQYDDVSEILGLFGLMRWIVRPGNEIYLVYTHNWLHTVGGDDASGGVIPDPHDRSFRTLTRGGAIKATYSFRW